MIRSLGAIIFDFDGTLIDASQAICHSFNGALRQRHYAAWPDDDIRAMIGRPLTDMFAEATGSADPQELELLIAAYREQFLPASISGSRALPGAVEVVEHFSPRVPLAIATSRHSDGAVHILRRLGLLSHFSAIVGLEQVEHPKPHPESVLRALQEVEAAPQESIMVGDTVDDIGAARSAGALSIGVATGAYSREQLQQAGAEFVLERISDLIALLAGRGFFTQRRRGAERC